MTKKRAIVSYEKLTIDQKKKLDLAFPNGFGGAMTQIKNPAGETLDAILWETEDIIYLVKIVKPQSKSVSLDDDDDDDVIDDIDVNIDEDDEDDGDDDDDGSYGDEPDDDSDDED
ncbi:MAG TPA: hypothetical protein PLP27_06545 [Crocinitomicaceae bacterium]|jgi:hypothetical protein|nr:hypothetical protein [Crocinitomicaceae bacterium]